MPSEFNLKRDVVFSEPIVGLGYGNSNGSSREKLLDECWVGQELSLIREPNNKHDPYAIAVHTTYGDQLGYLPRHDIQLAKHMDEGGAVLANINKIVPDDDGRPYNCYVTITKRLSDEQVRQKEYAHRNNSFRSEIKKAKSLEKSDAKKSVAAYVQIINRIKMIKRVNKPEQCVRFACQLIG